MDQLSKKSGVVRRAANVRAFRAGFEGDRVWIEKLEARRLFTIVPFAATVGQPVVDTLLATDIVLPANATGPEMFNAYFHVDNTPAAGYAYDYQPRLELQVDGSYDVYVDATFSSGGNYTVELSYRNDDTGGWDTLETGTASVTSAKFSGRGGTIDEYLPSVVAGLPTPESFAHFTPVAGPSTAGLTASITDGDGNALDARVEVNADGSVDVFSDSVLPAGGGYKVRLYEPGNAAAIGYAEPQGGGSVMHGIGMFNGTKAADGTYTLDLSTDTWGRDRFLSNGFINGYESTWDATIIWQDGNDHTADSESTATVNVDADGRVTLTYTRPAGLGEVEGMFKVKEHVARPAVDGLPAATVTVEYVGSWDTKGTVETPTSEPSTTIETDRGDVVITPGMPEVVLGDPVTIWDPQYVVPVQGTSTDPDNESRDDDFNVITDYDGEGFNVSYDYVGDATLSRLTSNDRVTAGGTRGLFFSLDRGSDELLDAQDDSVLLDA